MRRAVPRYIESALLALSDPKRSAALSEALAKTMPNCTRYVGTTLVNACEGMKQESEASDER